MKTLQEKVDEINKEFEFDMRFSIDVLSEKTLMIPAIKHKWVAKWMQVRMDKKLLSERRSAIVEFETTEISKSVKVGLSEDEIKKIKIKNRKDLKEIDDQLSDLALLEPYLKTLIDNMAYNLTKDVSNIIEGHKLETQ
jgi:hypothetical protein